MKTHKRYSLIFPVLAPILAFLLIAAGYFSLNKTLFLPVILSAPVPTSTPVDIPVRIPLQADWVDYGTILEAGAEGEWDYYLWGGFAFSVIKKGDTFYLYYQGSSDYRTEFDETVLWRSIGVATSTDGIHFTKHQENPVLTWFPTKNGEEGAVSSGITLGTNEEFVLYYGANTAMNATSVYADTRVATSIDGLNFVDKGIVLDHKSRAVWGSGDELFAVDAIFDQGRWIVYYIPNGTPERGLLGVGYGDQYNRLNHFSAATSGGSKIPVWGSAAHVKLDAGVYALILNNVREKRTEVRIVSTDAPASMSAPVAVYEFEEVHGAALLLDEATETWFMFYRTNENSYGVKLAPAREVTLSQPCPEK